jgi:3-phosphoglycerate kinase
MMKPLSTIGELKGMHVLMRTDLDVPLGQYHVIDEVFRIVRQRETVQYLLARGARVMLAGHISATDSLEPLIPQLERHLGSQIRFCRDFDEAQRFWGGVGSLGLLENLRTNPGEESNDAAFAGQLVAGCDAYVNNAFAVCHRAHASVAAAPLMVPSFAGLLVSQEVAELAKVDAAPIEGKVVYMGGAKASTKIPVVRHMLDRAEHIAVGGVLANDIFKEQGIDIGASRVDDDAHELLQGLDLNHPKLTIPHDTVMLDGQIMDIGNESAKAFAALAQGAKLIVWNGPLGKFEDPRYMEGTKVLAEAIALSGAWTVIGGGDTIAAVSKLGILDRFSYVSTGGGAMLAFLAGQQLPGLEALGYYETDADQETTEAA